MSYNVSVSLTKVDTAQPSGITFANTSLTVTDATGAVQSFTLTAPWTQAVTVAADGPSNYSAQDVDVSGAPIGPAVTATFTPAVVNFPATSTLSVTAA